MQNICYVVHLGFVYDQRTVNMKSVFYTTYVKCCQAVSPYRGYRQDRYTNLEGDEPSWIGRRSDVYATEPSRQP